MGKIPKEMRLKAVKVQCGVRNCTNIFSYSITRARENGNTVIMCEDCIREAYKSVLALIDEGGVNDKPAVDVANTESIAAVTEAVEAEKHICRYCGKECASHLGW